MDAGASAPAYPHGQAFGIPCSVSQRLSFANAHPFLFRRHRNWSGRHDSPAGGGLLERWKDLQYLDRCYRRGIAGGMLAWLQLPEAGGPHTISPRDLAMPEVFRRRRDGKPVLTTNNTSSVTVVSARSSAFWRRGGDSSHGNSGRRNSVHLRTGTGRMSRVGELIGRRRMAKERTNTVFEPRRLAVAAVGLLIVLGLTHIPQEVMPRQLQGHFIDKLEHAVAYGTITLLFLWAFRRPPGPKALLILLVVGMAVGALDETTQPLVNRIASTRDFAADCIGIVLVCAVYLMMRLCRRERRYAAPVGT